VFGPDALANSGGTLWVNNYPLGAGDLQLRFTCAGGTGGGPPTFATRDVALLAAPVAWTTVSSGAGTATFEAPSAIDSDGEPYFSAGQQIVCTWVGGTTCPDTVDDVTWECV
jgi:hypothetical protein